MLDAYRVAPPCASDQPSFRQHQSHGERTIYVERKIGTIQLVDATVLCGVMGGHTIRLRELDGLGQMHRVTGLLKATEVSVKTSTMDRVRHLRLFEGAKLR